MKNKWIVGIGLPIGIITAILVVASIGNISIDKIVVDNNDADEELTWHTIYIWTPTAENDPGFETGGFMSIFLLDYGAVPATVLANNATDWNTTGGTTHGYADHDNFVNDSVSEDPFYVVVRASFTLAQAASGGVYNGSRTRVTLTASGDETISHTVVGNGTAETNGGGIESENTTNEPKIYINFYWDDNSDGYRIVDDGSLTIDSIVIDAKY